MKRTLVISGGGSKGSYAVGFIDQLRSMEPILQFDAHVGTSTGALIAPFVALGKFDVLNRLYRETETKQVIRQKTYPPSFNQSSIYSTAPLRELIDQNLSDDECEFLIHSSNKDIYILTACLQTRKLTIFSTRDLPSFKSKIYDYIRIEDATHFKRAMLASANQPLFMPPIRVNKDVFAGPVRNRQYNDGGLLEYAGVEAAIDAGSDEVFTIYLSSTVQHIPTKTYDNLLSIVGPTVGILTGDVGFHDLRIPRLHNSHLKYIQEVKRRLLDRGISQTVIDSAFDVRVEDQEFDLSPPKILHLIRPSEILKSGTNGLEFNPTEMKNMFAIGQRDAKSFVNGLEQKSWKEDPNIT